MWSLEYKLLTELKIYESGIKLNKFDWKVPVNLKLLKLSDYRSIWNAGNFSYTYFIVYWIKFYIISHRSS